MTGSMLTPRGSALRALALAAALAGSAPAAAARPPLEPDTPAWSHAVRRSHRFGTAGLAMTVAAAPVTALGVLAFEHSTDFPTYFGSFLITSTGVTSILLGPAFLTVSSVKNAHRLRAARPDHSVAAGWASVAAFAGLYGYMAVLSTDPEAMTASPAVAWTLGGSFIAAGALQYGLNTAAALDHGVLVRPRDNHSAVSVRVVPRPRGLALAGRF